MSPEEKERIGRLSRNIEAAEARGDLAAAARMREALERLRRAPSAPPEKLPNKVAPADPFDGDTDGDAGHVRLTTAAGRQPVVHRLVGERRTGCRPNRPLAPTTILHPTADPVSCLRCGAPTDATVVDEHGAVQARREKREKPTGPRTGDPLPPSLDREEPLPPVERVQVPYVEEQPPEPYQGTETAATTGDLAALLLAAPLDARLALRVIGTLTADSVVGIMASRDGSLVVMAVD